MFSGSPYRCAMLEVQLTAVGELRVNNMKKIWVGDGPEHEFPQYCTALCVGVVESAISLEDGFPSPVGKKIAFIVKADNEETIDDLALEVGNHYLAYGMDFSYANHNTVLSTAENNLSLFEDLFGLNKNSGGDLEAEAVLSQFDCYMTVCDYASLPVIYNGENGVELRTDLREYHHKEGSIVYMTKVPAEEVVPQYTVPTVEKLDGSAEEYLQSEEGALWRQMLEDMEISNHGFPVLAVDKPGYQMAFTQENARIVEGRDFTEKERTEGSKVCIVSETLATQNQLSVGDKLQMQTYANDHNIGNPSVDLLNSSFPCATMYSHAMGFTSEMEEYEIVGIYRQNNAWENVDDPYGFTPNTIFVPKDSISGDARTGTKGIFYTLVLHNGKMEELQELQNEAGYPDLFLCFDQGYSDIVEALDAYEGVSQKAFYIGIAGCAVIMLLFLVLFPLQQGRNLSIMSSLGAPRSKRIGFIVGSSFGILLPGVVISGTAGALLWKQVAAKLMESVNVLIPMNADTVVLSVSISAALLAAMLLAVTLIAIPMSSDKGLMKRK